MLVQFRSQSLIEHLKDGWQFGAMLPDHFITPVPAQMRMGETWYQGTADAIFQNLNLIEDRKPDLVAVFGADHVYRMDVQQMLDFHLERKAAVTVATLPVAFEEADQFGVIEVDSGLQDCRLRGKARASARDARRARQVPGLDGQLPVRSAGSDARR